MKMSILSLCGYVKRELYVYLTLSLRFPYVSHMRARARARMMAIRCALCVDGGGVLVC